MHAFHFRPGAWIATGAAVLLFSGCDKTVDGGAGSGHKSAACEHMQESLSQIVRAAASREATLPEMGSSTRYAIDLANVAGPRESYVAFKAEKATDYHFALTAPLTLEITDAAGAVVLRKGAVDTASGCDEVKAIHTYALAKGRYVLHFSSGSGTSVDLVAVEAGADAH